MKRKLILQKSLIISLFLLWPYRVFATPMGIFFVEGVKPSRVVYVTELPNSTERSVDLMSDTNTAIKKKIEKSPKQAEMRVIAVYEHEAAPVSIDMTLELQCHKKMYRIREAHAVLRDESEKNTKQDWKSYPSNNISLLLAAENIVCEHDHETNAFKEMILNENKEHSNAFDQFGITYIGDLDRPQVVDTVWKTILGNGNRPTYKSKALTEKSR